jgi:hypothetical protein
MLRRPTVIRSALFVVRLSVATFLGFATLQLLVNPSVVASYAASGLPTGGRLVLCGIELLAAVLFVPSPTVWLGVAGLLASFATAAWVHLQLGQPPNLLAGYAVVVVTLALATGFAEQFPKRRPQIERKWADR